MLLTTDLPVKWTGTAVSPQATAEVLEIDDSRRQSRSAPDRLQDIHAVDAGVDRHRAGPDCGAGRAGPDRAAAAAAGRGGFPAGPAKSAEAQRPRRRAPTRSRSQRTLRMFLSEYKVVNGIKLPHLMVRGAGDQVTEEWVIKSYRINPNLKADTFTKMKRLFIGLLAASVALSLRRRSYAQNTANQAPRRIRLAAPGDRRPDRRRYSDGRRHDHAEVRGEPVTFKSDEQRRRRRRRRSRRAT